jgi:urease accessory protein
MQLKLNRNLWSFLGAIALTLLPIAAQAHPGHSAGTTGFLDGFGHPLGGLDHVLAMVAVGLWAVQLGGKAVWAVPLAFIGVMAGSAAIGTIGLQIPGIEQGIALSDSILGLLILAAIKLPTGLGMLIVAILASFHGYAHGVEMPQSASGLAYGCGFIIATTLLHSTGLGFAMLVKNQKVIQWIGGAIAMTGGYLFFNTFAGV